MHRLSDYRGRWLLLYFYPRDRTFGCTTEARAFRDAYGDFSGKAVIVGVSGDTVESHRKFAERHQLPFPLLADPDRNIIEAYGADGVIRKKRSSFLIDPEGKIARIYDDVIPERHPAEVLEDMAMLVG